MEISKNHPWQRGYERSKVISFFPWNLIKELRFNSLQFQSVWEVSDLFYDPFLRETLISP